jgi:uncharacterized delta-60 repeat protein
VARYLPDGQPDPAFGPGGTLTLDAFVGADLAIQPDGTPDATFGDNGTVQRVLDRSQLADRRPRPRHGAAIALQPDGRIVVAGATGGLNSNFAIARRLADGTLDTDTGVMTFDFFGFTDVAEAVAVTDDGRIVVGGLARDNVDGYGVARLSPQAALHA